MAKNRPIRRATPELQRLRAHAQQLTLSKRHDLAETALRQVLAIGPNDPQFNRHLAACLLALRRTDEALEQARATVAIDPVSPAALSLLGAILTVKGLYDQAVRAFEQALQIDANFIPALYGLSNVFGVKADWIPALEWTEKGLAIKPDHAGMLRIRGETLAALNRKEEAIATMEQFLRLAPDTVDSQRAASAILKRIGKTEEAIKFAERALKMNPADPHVHNSLAQLNLINSRFDDAHRHFQHATEIYDSRRDGQKGPNQIEIKSLLGQAAGNLIKRNLSLAEAQYKRILQSDPTNQWAPSLLAGALAEQCRFDEALPMAREAVQAHPKLLSPRVILAATLLEMERHDEAMTYAQQALELNPNSALPHRVLAWIYLNLENYAQAFEEAEKALAVLQDTFSKSLFAVALAAVGRREEAIPAIEATLTEDPDIYNCQGTAGYAFYLLKEYGQAELHYRRAMELDHSGLGCHGRLGLVYFDRGRIAEALPLLEKSYALNPYRRHIRAALAAIAASGPSAEDRVEPFELDSRISGRELPVDRHRRLVSLLLPCRDLAF